MILRGIERKCPRCGGPVVEFDGASLREGRQRAGVGLRQFWRFTLIRTRVGWNLDYRRPVRSEAWRRGCTVTPDVWRTRQLAHSGEQQALDGMGQS
jgi:hypothetical protein